MSSEPIKTLLGDIQEILDDHSLLRFERDVLTRCADAIGKLSTAYDAADYDRKELHKLFKMARKDLKELRARHGVDHE